MIKDDINESIVPMRMPMSAVNVKLDKKKFKNRVDMQVSLLTAIITLLSSLTIFGICYSVTYQDAIQEINDRAEAIYERVDRNLNMATFQQIGEKIDRKSMAYEEARIQLNTIRETTGAKFISTCKQKADGSLIYVVDGLRETDEEYHYPGDAIEPDMEQGVLGALQGETVYATKMTRTSWGKGCRIFYPAYYSGEVVGVIEICFETGQQYATYGMMARVTPIVCIVCCLVATYISYHVFRRISNPNYKDVYNTDILTGLKNRNSFEVDLGNLNVHNILDGRAVLSIDLNNLKKINDTYGHNIGDKYIHGAAEILSKYSIEGAVAYRTGGDEFTILVEHGEEEILQKWVNKLKQLMEDYEIGDKQWNSMAIGYAIFDPSQDHNLLDTYKRADHEMYVDKQRQKAIC